MENGKMDSDSKLSSESNQYILDIDNKLSKSCFNADTSITYQSVDNGESSISLHSVPLMRNDDISSHNGGISFERCGSCSIGYETDVSISHQNQCCKIFKEIKSSQCNFNPLKSKGSDVEDKLTCLTLSACASVKISEFNSAQCPSNCNRTLSQENIENEVTRAEIQCSLNNGNIEQKLGTLESLPEHDMNSYKNDVLEEMRDDTSEISYISYESENQMPDIMKLIQKDLSEPYSIYTYRYFIHNWPHLCFLAVSKGKSVGAIVCKLDLHRKIIKRGYIAMLAVDECYRKKGIGSNLVLKAIRVMAGEGADEVVLETEITNQPALRLYENLGFVRDKRLFRYYLNGVDALRLKLWLR